MHQPAGGGRRCAPPESQEPTWPAQEVRCRSRAGRPGPRRSPSRTARSGAPLVPRTGLTQILVLGQGDAVARLQPWLSVSDVRVRVNVTSGTNERKERVVFVLWGGSARGADHLVCLVVLMPTN